VFFLTASTKRAIVAIKQQHQMEIATKDKADVNKHKKGNLR